MIPFTESAAVSIIWTAAPKSVLFTVSFPPGCAESVYFGRYSRLTRTDCANRKVVDASRWPVSLRGLESAVQPLATVAVPVAVALLPPGPVTWTPKV